MPPGDAIEGLGARSDLIGRDPGFQPATAQLSIDELVLFALIGSSEPIAEVLSRSGLPERTAVAALRSLLSKGAIRTQGAATSAAPTPAPAARPFPAAPTPRAAPAPTPAPTPAPPAVRERAVDAAAVEEVDLPPERKAEILELEQKLQTANYFQLLGVPPDADRIQIREAYHQASLKFHPDRYFNRNLGSFRARLELIFRKLSEAHSVLVDDAKRAVYLGARPELRRAATPAPARELTEEEKVRSSERRSRFSKHPYLAKAGRVTDLLAQARAHMAREEHDQALALLNNAVQIDPNHREGAQLLTEARKLFDLQRTKEGLARAKALDKAGDTAGALAQYRAALQLNPKVGEAAAAVALHLARSGADLPEARMMALRAVELMPRNATAFFALGMVYLALDQKKQAKEAFREALERDEAHAEAKKHLKDLKWVF